MKTPRPLQMLIRSPYRFVKTVKCTVTPPYRRETVVMLHYGRCGSTVLARQIAQNLEILWEGELFNMIFRGRFPEYKFLRDPFRLLQVRRLCAGMRMYGLEVNFHHRYDLSPPVLDMSPQACFQKLKDAGATHFIVLKRKNYLRQQISEEVGRQQNQWHRNKDEDAPLHSVTLDPERVRFGGGEVPLIDSLRERDAMYDVIESLLTDEPSLWLTFEDNIRDDPRDGYRRACKFLGLDPVETSINTRRTNPYAVRHLLDNYNAVANCLKNTKYEWMLEN